MKLYKAGCIHMRTSLIFRQTPRCILAIGIGTVLNVIKLQTNTIEICQRDCINVQNAFVCHGKNGWKMVTIVTCLEEGKDSDLHG